MTDTIADRKSVRQREKAARISAAQRAAVVRNIMSTIEGRHWAWDLLATCGIFSSTFTADPHLTAFNEGQRAVGLRLLADIMTHCPDLYLLAQQEANVRSTIDERRRSPQLDGGDSGSVDPAYAEHDPVNLFDLDGASDIYNDHAH